MPGNTRHALTTTWATVVTVALGGCAAGPAADDPLELGPLRPPRGTLARADLLPWTSPHFKGTTRFESIAEGDAPTTRFEIVEGPDTGALLIETRRPGPTERSWLVSRRVDGEAGPREERLLVLNSDDGPLLMPEMLNFARGVRVEMDPPTIVLPARIDPAQPITRELRMRLPLLANPRRLRDRGIGTSELTYPHDQRVRTPAGIFNAHLLREVFTSRLGTATAVRTTDRWFAPEVGLVAERWTEEVRVLGVVVDRSRQAIRLLPPAAPPPASEP